jgi:predicted dehydrogenase
MNMKRLLILILSLPILISCGSGGSKKLSGNKTQPAMEKNYQVKLMTVDPGHFHAALVQKIMNDQVSPDVHVYAPQGPDYLQHLDRIKLYNSRKTDPTSWNEIVYTGPDFFDKMLEERPGNVVVLSGNNQKKADYISRSINAGLNVLADKPMIISAKDFPTLVQAFKTASEKGTLLYDIMTERYEITSILQKILSQNEEIFGKLITGTKEEPAVSKISTHSFSKLVSGVPLQRPAWFFDVEQQGDGIVDITTHLIDLVQWECFSGQQLDTNDIKMESAKRWPTIIFEDEFEKVTGLKKFPEYLQKDVQDNIKLFVFSNGEMVYQIKGVWVKVATSWDYMPPAGAGDTYFSVLHGSKCDLVIRQGAEEKYLPTLYVENVKGLKMDKFTSELNAVLGTLPYDSLFTESAGNNIIRVNIPNKYRETHEEHFGRVMSKFLEYMEEGKVPEWEVQCMIAKYYTTTRAIKMAKGE